MRFTGWRSVWPWRCGASFSTGFGGMAMNKDSEALRNLMEKVGAARDILAVTPKTAKINGLVFCGRWALTAALIFGVYTETGVWTAISMTLIFVAIEIIVLIPRGET